MELEGPLLIIANSIRVPPDLPLIILSDGEQAKTHEWPSEFQPAGVFLIFGSLLLEFLDLLLLLRYLLLLLVDLSLQSHGVILHLFQCFLELLDLVESVLKRLGIDHVLGHVRSFGGLRAV